MAVAVGVYRMAHGFVMGFIVEKPGDFPNYEVVIGADQPYCSSLEGFRAFGGVSHHEHRLAETGGLFLYAAGIGEHQI